MKRKNKMKFFEESKRIVSSMPTQVLREADDYQKSLVEKISKVNFNVFQEQSQNKES